MKLLLENWRTYINEAKERSAEELEAIFAPKGYDIEEELGRGAFGIVYAARRKDTGEPVAIKVITLMRSSAFTVSAADFRGESENYEFLKDNKSSLPAEVARHFPDVYETGKIKGGGYIVMERLIPMDPKVVAHMFGSLANAGVTDRLDLQKGKVDRFMRNPEVVYNVFHSTVQKVLGGGGGGWLGKYLFALQDFEIDSGADRSRVVPLQDTIENIAKGAFEKFIKGEYEALEPKMDAAANKMGSSYFLYTQRLERNGKNEIIMAINALANAAMSRLSDSYVYFDKAINGNLAIIGTNGQQMANWDRIVSELIANRMASTFDIATKRSLIPTTLTGLDTDDAHKDRVAGFPEAKSLFSAMEYVKKAGFEPADVHSNNVMARKSTGELVIVDVGMFDLMR